MLPTISLLVSAAIIVVAGLFTIRSSIASTWKENYEAETERRKLAEQEADEQRASKHEALNELAAAKLRTDITGLMKFARELRDETNRERTELEQRLRAEHAEIIKVLEDIRRAMEGR